MKMDELALLSINEIVNNRSNQVDDRQRKPDGYCCEHHQVGSHRIFFLTLADFFRLWKRIVFHETKLIQRKWRIGVSHVRHVNLHTGAPSKKTCNKVVNPFW